jgi:hypothetical protein
MSFYKLSLFFLQEQQRPVSSLRARSQESGRKDKVKDDPRAGDSGANAGSGGSPGHNKSGSLPRSISCHNSVHKENTRGRREIITCALAR